MFAAGIDITFVPRPQYAKNSCRSYALVLAAGTMPETPVPVTNVQELRAAEKDMEARLKSTAQAMSNSTRIFGAGDHEVWKRAVSEMTSGSLELVIESKPTMESFYRRVEELTGITNAEQWGALFSSTIVKTPVMTSVLKIGGNRYETGHIVTVYGLSSSTGPTSQIRSLAVLNPAVKLPGGQRNICDIDGVKNDERWSAVVSLENAYELKPFSNAFMVMWLRRVR
jgi:hypothetical protein